MAELAKRVYSLEVSGYDDSIRKFQALTAAFQAADEAKKKLNLSLSAANANGDAAAVAKLTTELGKLQTQQATLQTQLAATRKEADALSTALDNASRPRNNSGGTTGTTTAPGSTPSPVTSPTAAIPIPTIEINQYAKSLAEVAELQVRNGLQLKANRDAQAALTREISIAGSATEDQIRVLTQLRQEQVQLQAGR